MIVSVVGVGGDSECGVGDSVCGWVIVSVVGECGEKCDGETSGIGRTLT